MNVNAFTLADPDYYRPIETGDKGSRFAPTGLPAEWQPQEFGIWTSWTRPGLDMAEQGWKVHVSSSLDNAAEVLDIVGDVCAELSVPFKHLTGKRLFLWMHHKHGSRVQSGKFAALYPASPEAAYELLTRLESALADFTGPYVLTDRRFGSSTCVSYRYGSYVPRSRVAADGTRIPVLIGVDGLEIPDERRPQFQLPPGVSDPFTPAMAAVSPAEVAFGGYRFTRTIQRSNAGGAYQALSPDDRTVFVKEARGHNGYQWDGSTAVERLRHEHRILTEIHAAAPGLCPEPLARFAHWEHEFLVTEFIPGRSLWSWMASVSPAGHANRSHAYFADYYARCRAILDSLRHQLDRLHELGFVFGDLNPNNVIVDQDERPRLIDFEAAGRIGEPRHVMGAPGYLPPGGVDAELAGSIDPRHYDDYGLAALAQTLLHPIIPVLDRYPPAAAHLRADLVDAAHLPDDLWRRATRYRPCEPDGALPSPAEVAADPDRWLTWLRDRTADALLSMADPSAALAFPSVPQAHGSNPFNVAYGTAGVLHALRVAGLPAPEKIVDGLADRALAERDTLPPGLIVGTAGIAWVLADLGLLDAAGTLLAHADAHPLLIGNATLGHGMAGVALAHLALHRHNGDQAHLDRAAALLRDIPDGTELVALLGRNEATGWLFGRPGIAHALYYLAALTGDDAALHRGRKLLHDELAHGYQGYGGLSFYVSRTDRRVEPYLTIGSAGFAMVAGRYLRHGCDEVLRDEVLRDAYAAAVTSMQSLFPLRPALFQGLSGLGFAASDLARLDGDESLRAAAVRMGRGLFKYAIPGEHGVRFLAEAGNRFSADLGHGSAGVLLFLAQLLDRSADALFTLDAAAPVAARLHLARSRAS